MCIRDSQYIDQWGLGEEFAKWVDEENLFCSTLVDRIVTGYPRAEAAKLNEDVYKRQCPWKRPTCPPACRI